MNEKSWGNAKEDFVAPRSFAALFISDINIARNN